MATHSPAAQPRLPAPVGGVGTTSPRVQPIALVQLAARREKKSKKLFSLASWYGRVLHGHRTASGERFDMFRMTAAHNSLPFGTLVQVKNLRNGRSVVVRINDRGEMVDGRIDLSFAAAKQLKMMKSGIDQVELEVLDSKPGPLLEARASLK